MPDRMTDKKPRVVRNFWLEARVDGFKTDIGTGPKSKDGGMWVKIKRRLAGQVADGLDIECIAKSDGKILHINIYGPDGALIWNADWER